MSSSNHPRAIPGTRLPGVCLCCLLLLNAIASAQAIPDPPAQDQAQQTPSQPADAAPSQSDNDSSTQTTVAAGAQAAVSAPSKRQAHEAEEAYLAGAKKLDHDDLDAAEREFVHALNLDPENRNYALAISVTREHRLTELVRQASKARQAGDGVKAEALLDQARAIDPQSPFVLEHSGPFVVAGAIAPPSIGAAANYDAAPRNSAQNFTVTPLADRTQMLASPVDNEPWKPKVPVLAGPIHLTPAQDVKSFHLRSVSPDVIRDVAFAYGIRAVIDDSVERKDLRFDLENVTYAQAMSVLMSMAHVFIVPVDETSAIFAKDSPDNHKRLQRQLEETIFMPGSTTEQINEMANVVRTIFDVSQATAQTNGVGSIVVRAPEEVLDPMNLTLQDLMDGTGEVVIEVRMYETTTTRGANNGATVPTQFGVFNVDAAAAQIVSANQTLVQQGIAQGLIDPTKDSTLKIALLLLASGLVQSNLLSSLVGVFGGKAFMTGITETGGATFNLGQNTSDTRALDDVQLRVGDQQLAVFKEGTRYPITSSTYSSGLSTVASQLSNANINGASIANLISQFAGGSSATIPQVTYEDLGVSLEATPHIQKTGRINMHLNLKIEALGGGSANGIPVLQNRQFNSDISVLDGESAILVSNVSRNETSAMTGIPVLSELPGFEMPVDDSLEKDTGQLVVIVTPHLVRRRSDPTAGPRVAVHLQSSN